MRTFLIASTAILLAAVPALAYRPMNAAPYVGVNLQFNNPTGDFGKARLAPDGGLMPGDGAADAGAGVEFDVGLASRNMNAYMGGRFNRFDVNSPDGWQGKWTADRFVVGARGNLLTDPMYNVVPTLGGGVTLGNTHLEGALPGNFVTERRSDTNLGWFIEGGINAHLTENADLLANLQYHSFGAEFNDIVPGEHFDISFVTLQIGVAVRLGQW